MKAIQCHDKVQLLHLEIFWTDSQSSKARTMGKERDMEVSDGCILI